MLSVHFVVTANFLTNADWYILFLKIDIFGAEILRVTTLLGNASVLGQSGFEHASPLASGGIFPNGGADLNGWPSRFQSEVRILTINITFYPSNFTVFAEVFLTRSFHFVLTHNIYLSVCRLCYSLTGS